MDEPTNGLDPAGIVDLRKLLTEVAAEGTAIFVASHLLTEVERICHRVLLVRAGEILKDLDLRRHGPTKIRLVVANEKSAEIVLRSELGAERIQSESEAPTFLLEPKASLPDLVRTLVKWDVDVEEVAVEKQSLEKEFLTLFR